MYRISTIILILILSKGYHLSAQNKHTIEAIVMDMNEGPLVGATAVVLNQQDSIMKGFAISNNQGLIQIKNIPNGDFILQITYIGFANNEQAFSLSDQDPEKTSLGNIIMSTQSTEVDVVEIKAEHIPMVIKKDTVEYNADAFKTQPNAVVEDLLKRLPGVEVEKDGTVSAQGEEVQNVLVDGKEFFGRDPKMATKNLPADIVDKVQVYDRKSDMAEFSGIDDGNEEKTINLKIKDGKNKGYFGTVTGGAGTEESYEFKTSLNRFSKNTQLSFLGMSNNINDRGFSFNDYSQFMGGMQNVSRGSFRNSDVPLNFQDGDGLTTTSAGGLNFNHDFTEKVQLQSSYFLTSIDAYISDNTSSENLLGLNSFSTISDSETETESLGHNVNFRLEVEIDSSQDFRVTSRTNFSNIEGRSDQFVGNSNQLNILLGNSDRLYINEQENLNSTNRFIYRKRLDRNGRMLIADANYTKGFIDGELFLSNVNQFFELGLLDSIEYITQDQITDNDNDAYNIGLSYTEPINDQYYIEFHTDLSNTTTDNIKDFIDIYPLDIRELNEELSSFYNRDYQERVVGTNLRYSGDIMNFSAGVDFQQSILDGSIVDESIDIKNNWNYFLPSLNVNYDIDDSKRLRFSYRTRINEPSLTQLQPVQDNSNPQNIQIGNPELVPEYTHSFNVRYNLFDQFSFTSWFNNLRVTYRKNNIIDSTAVDRFFQKTQTPINADYALNVSNRTYYSRPVHSLSAKIRLSTNLSYNRSQVYVSTLNDAIINNQDRYSANVGFRIENKSKNHFDLSIGTNQGITKTNFSISSNQNQSFAQQSYFSELIVYLPQSWVFETDYDYTNYSQESFADDNLVQLWRASISKGFMNHDKLRLKLSVFDILNQNRGISRTANAEVIQESITNALGRFAMLSATYRISSFNGAKGNGGSRRGGPPGGRF